MDAVQRTRAMTPRHWLAIGLALLLVGGAVGAQVLARPAAPAIRTGTLSLVDNTTLLPLRGDVQVQVVGGTTFETVVGPRALQVGDRVRTGAGAHASIVYFDGSSSALEPETELVLQRFERDPVTGATAIIVQQPLGTTWTQAAAAGHQFSGFLLASTAARFFARGSQFTTEVAPEGAMTVTAVEGGVFGRADSGDVDLPSGFTTKVRPGQPPDAPLPAAQPAATLQVSVQGPVRALLSDAWGRSVGYHPDSEAYVTQIPGARLVRNDDGTQVFSVPAPVEGYDLTLRGLGAGQAVVAVGVLRPGEREAPAAVRLEAPVASGDVQAGSFAWKDGQVRDVKALAPAPGTPAGSAVMLLRHTPPPLALAATSTPVPEASAEAEADADAVAAKPPAEPEAADVFSSFDSPVTPLRPPVISSNSPSRPSIVTEPAPVRQPTVREPVVRAPERESTRPPVVLGLNADDDTPTARPTAVPTAAVVVVTATLPPPTPVPPTPVPPTPLPPTPVPPTPLPTVPPPLPTPVPTQPPARQAAPAVRPTVGNSRPSIAPTATPYVAPSAPGAPAAGPTRCLYPGC